MSARLPFVLALLCGLAGCASRPVADCPAPVVMSEPVTVEVPVHVPRPVPRHLLSPLVVFAPDVLSAGDYCLSRDGFETLLDAIEQHRERIERWEAWASPAPGSP